MISHNYTRGEARYIRGNNRDRIISPRPRMTVLPHGGSFVPDYGGRDQEGFRPLLPVDSPATIIARSI
jgi:hypothetical protein